MTSDIYTIDDRLRNICLMAKSEDKTRVSDSIISIVTDVYILEKFLNIYWSEGVCPLSNQIKRGLKIVLENIDLRDCYLSPLRTIEVVKKAISMAHPRLSNIPNILR